MRVGSYFEEAIPIPFLNQLFFEVIPTIRVGSYFEEAIPIPVLCVRDSRFKNSADYINIRAEKSTQLPRASSLRRRLSD